MNTRFIFYLLFIWTLALPSCSPEKSNGIARPKHLIEKEKLTNILIDIHLIEASLTQYYNGPVEIRQEAAVFYSLLFKKHGISHKDFIESYYYYAEDLKAFGKIYQDVITKLSVLLPGRQKKEN